MNTFFCCTSMAHLFTAIYITEKYYKGSKNVKLVLLSQMKEMIKLIPQLEMTSLWEDVLVIDNEAKSLEYIKQQIDVLLKAEPNEYYLFGFENVSFSIAVKCVENSKIIYVDEGGTTYNITATIQSTYMKENFDGIEFPLDKINEIWLTEPKMWVSDLDVAVKKLYISKDLEDNDFYHNFSQKINLVFPDARKLDYQCDILYFDSYLASIGLISVEFEELMLKETENCIENLSLSIKPHPNERYWEKYKLLSSSIVPNSYVPWEAVMFSEKNNHNKVKIYMTCASSAVFKQRFLLNDFNSYIILVYKIYESYCPGLKEVLELEFVTKYIEAFNDEKLLLPKSFEELNNMIINIQPNCIQPNIKKDVIINNFFQNEYWKLWSKSINVFNFSTLYCENQEIKLPILLKNKVNDINLCFDFAQAQSTDVKTESNQLLWYVARGVAIKIKINYIEYEYDRGIKKRITLDLFKNELYGDENGYNSQNNFDMIINLPCYQKISKIFIKAKIYIFETYNECCQVYHNKMNKVNNDLSANKLSIEKLLEDIDKRDYINSEMSEAIKEKSNINIILSEDIKNRDSVIENLSKSLQERDEVLNSLMRDIDNRDNIITGLRKDVEDRDYIIGQKCDEIKLFSNSFWGRQYKKRIKNSK